MEEALETEAVLFQSCDHGGRGGGSIAALSYYWSVQLNALVCKCTLSELEWKSLASLISATMRSWRVIIAELSCGLFLLRPCLL